MVVGMHRLVITLLFAEKFQCPIGDHLVGIHVG